MLNQEDRRIADKPHSRVSQDNVLQKAPNDFNLKVFVMPLEIRCRLRN